MNVRKTAALPEIFRPILWSYDFSKLDLERDKKTIIVNTINYGDLPHWRWIAAHYSKEAIKEVLENIPASEIRSRVLQLASILFSVRKFNYAPRGSRR